MSVGPGACQRAHLVHQHPPFQCPGQPAAAPPQPPPCRWPRAWERGAAVLGGAMTREELPKQEYCKHCEKMRASADLRAALATPARPRCYSECLPPGLLLMSQVQ